MYVCMYVCRRANRYLLCRRWRMSVPVMWWTSCCWPSTSTWSKTWVWRTKPAPRSSCRTGRTPSRFLIGFQYMLMYIINNFSVCMYACMYICSYKDWNLVSSMYSCKCMYVCGNVCMYLICAMYCIQNRICARSWRATSEALPASYRRRSEGTI